MKSSIRILLVHYLLLPQFGHAFSGRLNTKPPTSIPMVASITSSEPGFLLKSRLIEGGIPSSDIELRADDGANLNNGEPASFSSSTTSTSSTVEIKTLVWEVSCNHQEPLPEDDTAVLDKVYIVTAQKMADKVDVSLLRDLVHAHLDLPFGCTPPRLSMAPTKTAEHMTGFSSGCMPPIGHTVPMKLYVEESIAGFEIASVASGSVGHSLLLPMGNLLAIAENNRQGLQVGRFAQSARSGSPSSVLETNNAQQQNPNVRRGTEPKDRLAEYKSMDCIARKAKLLRTTARKKGRVDIMRELIDEAVQTGDFPELLATSEDNGLDKSALHLCSWRGDFETVKLLVETSKKHFPEMDIVNTISKGSGNYGKTPIFYALTQCREDVVLYLVTQGASLLLVNNKGQTPCSIAVSHLEEASCQILFEAEAEQLRSGGVFANCRTSHSDGKLYGDLDPRFEIDSINNGDDIIQQIEDYRKSIAKGATGGIPTSFSPRSLRPTVRWWNRKDGSLRNANNNSGTSDQMTFTQARIKVDRQLKVEVQPSQPPKSNLSPITPKRVLDIDSLEVLTLDQVLNSRCLDVGVNNESRILVDCIDSIRILESEIDRTILHAITPTENEDETGDRALVGNSWGLDCEWLPGEGKECGGDNPVATLQLSTQRYSFLIDLQSLCQALHLDESIPDYSVADEIEVQLNLVLSKLFAGKNVPVVGFGVLQDLAKLAVSFPHLPCFRLYNSVIDVQKVSNIALSKSDRQNASSLRAMVALLMHRRLDKSQQCSDWTRRPFSIEQVEYATLDAAVLPLMLKRIAEQSFIEIFNGQFFELHPRLTQHVKFMFLEEEDNPSQTYHIPMGKITTMFSKLIARQCWPSNQDTAPEPPTKRAIADPRPSKKERAHIRKVGPANGGKKPKPVQLRDIMGNLDNLPAPGETLGYTKDSCVHRVVGNEFIDTLPKQTHIGFNRRSGVSETSNAWIIFCNFGGPMRKSIFLAEGREFKFNLNPNNFHGKSSEKSLFDFLSSQWTSLESDRKILLFARGSTRHKYTYCGVCECLGLFPKEECGTTDLLLDLINYAELVGENKISGDFLELVQIAGTPPAK